MPKTRILLIAGASAAAVVLSNVAPPILGLGGPAAFAKNDHDDNGNGNGGGNGKGNDNGSEIANANASGGNSGGGNSGNETRGPSSERATGGSGKSAVSPPGLNKPAVSTAVVTTTPGKSAGTAQSKSLATAATSAAKPAAGNAKTPGLDAQIAGLHAANANLQAFIHAAPNSKVGEIAAYAKAEVAVEIAAAVRDAAQATLDAATATLATAGTTYADAIAVLTTTYLYADTSDAALQARLIDLAATDTSMFTPDQIDALNAEIAAVNTALADSTALADAQLAYDTAAGALATAETDLAAAQTAMDGALNAAANPNRTPVDPAVKAWVDAQLEAGGILDYFRTEAETVTVQ
jgi:hypothetical protein